MKCSICAKEFSGDEHNALPITTGTCCDECNQNIVIPTRIYQLGLNTKEALMITPDYKVNIIKPKANKFSLAELQNLVQGYIEIYPTNNKKHHVLVNEEGLLMRLPFNELSSKIYGIHAVGNVLLVPKRLFS
jgi:DNA-directed RNA polymerase subunit RPC12/RpoP